MTDGRLTRGPNTRIRSRSVNPVWGRLDIACRRFDVETFFMDGKGAATKAKSICQLCPADARDECREWAIETRQQYGVLGGMTHTERKAEFKRRAEAQHQN